MTMRDRLRRHDEVIVAAVVFGLLLFLFVACDSYNTERGRGDAPVGTVVDDPVSVRQMPDAFGNIAYTCIGVDGIYVNTREAAPVVVPNDPNCGPPG